MTGWQVVERLKMKLAQTGFSTTKLAPDKVLALLVDQMFEINGRTTLAVTYLTFPTAANKRHYRLRDGVGGSYLTPLKILRASYNGKPLQIERPFQYDGDTDAGTTPPIGAPRNVWIETQTLSLDNTALVCEKSIGVYPLPDQIYTIRMVSRMPVPTYTNLNAEIPIRQDAHEASLTAVMAELFAGRDFHDNAMKVLWEQKRQAAERELIGWDQRLVTEHQQDVNTGRFLVQVE